MIHYVALQNYLLISFGFSTCVQFPTVDRLLVLANTDLHCLGVISLVFSEVSVSDTGDVI